jgi:hypothetical protein
MSIPLSSNRMTLNRGIVRRELKGRYSRVTPQNAGKHAEAEIGIHVRNQKVWICGKHSWERSDNSP